MKIMQQRQISTMTFFRYRGIRQKLWALSQMQLAIGGLMKTAGLPFFKLMGSGAGEGFSLQPDFSTYCLLGVWENEGAADRFFAQSEVWKAFVQHAEEQWTVYALATRARGLWSKQQPFVTYPEEAGAGIKVALTRASIRWSRLPDFWRHVPQTSRAIAEAEGVLFSKGVGELPFVQQATLSIWESEEAMRQFAYRDKAHREVVQKTVKRRWYSEELFASFRPLRSTGSWRGGDILASLQD